MHDKSDVMASADEILLYWFGPKHATDPEELSRNITRWYRGGPEMAREIEARFATDVERALAGDYDDWAEDPCQRRALILLLDQFTRNIFAGSARAFAGDQKAQALSTDALARGWDANISLEERLFLLMPLMHAESVELLERCIVEIDRLNDDAPPELKPIYGIAAAQARKYRDVIARFGRFPHRNEALGRVPTAEEAEFMQTFRQVPADPK
jgi:uncharacterized protein (DUF924 family)